MVAIAAAARARLDHEHNGRALLAFNIAALHRAKRLRKTDLDKLMIKRRKRRQTVAQQRAAIRAIAGTFGG